LRILRDAKMKDNIIVEKSFAFAIRIVNLYRYLIKKNEFVLSKQVLRCGTSIGANVREAVQAQSRADFLSKISIALKESNETLYWLELLDATDFMAKRSYDSIHRDCDELICILTKIVKTTRRSFVDK